MHYPHPQQGMAGERGWVTKWGSFVEHIDVIMLQGVCPRALI